MSPETPLPSRPQAFRYENFDIGIRRGPGDDYTVTARSATEGETSDVIRFPFDADTLERREDKLRIALGRGKTRQVCPDDERPVRDFGTEMYHALFPARIRGLFEASRALARQEEKGLRLRLHMEAPELAALPWEFLYDPEQGDYVCLSRDIPVVRYIDAPVETRPLRIAPPLRILCMVAGPVDCATLNVEREKELLRKAVGTLVENGQVQLVFAGGQTWRDLMQMMREGPFHIFHFIGHSGFSVGDDEGYIALRAEDGSTYPLRAQQLARFLADQTSLRLVVLNSCEGARGSGRDIFSSTSSILVRRGIPAVVGMQYPISDEGAIEFSRSFYESLADGLPVDASVAEARKAVSAAFSDSVEWGTPVLTMRSPDGTLFEIDRVQAPVKKAVEPQGDYIPPPRTITEGTIKQAYGPTTGSGEDGTAGRAAYPIGYSALGIVTVLGALFILWFNSEIGTGFNYGIMSVLSLSGTILLLCGALMIFRQPRYSHYLLVANWLIAFWALAMFFLGYNPWSAWILYFLIPGGCVSLFYYPLRSRHPY